MSHVTGAGLSTFKLPMIATLFVFLLLYILNFRYFHEAPTEGLRLPYFFSFVFYSCLNYFYLRFVSDSKMDRRLQDRLPYNHFSKPFEEFSDIPPIISALDGSFLYDDGWSSLV
jgi:hypothetical protein